MEGKDACAVTHSHSLKLTHNHSHSYTHSHTLSLSPSHTHTHTRSRRWRASMRGWWSSSRTRTTHLHTFTHSHTLTHTVSPTHTHSHTLPHTPGFGDGGEACVGGGAVHGRARRGLQTLPPRHQFTHFHTLTHYLTLTHSFTYSHLLPHTHQVSEMEGQHAWVVERFTDAHDADVQAMEDLKEMHNQVQSQPSSCFFEHEMIQNHSAYMISRVKIVVHFLDA